MTTGWCDRTARFVFGVGQKKDLPMKKRSAQDWVDPKLLHEHVIGALIQLEVDLHNAICCVQADADLSERADALTAAMENYAKAAKTFLDKSDRVEQLSEKLGAGTGALDINAAECEVLERLTRLRERSAD